MQEHLDVFLQELGYRKAEADPDQRAKRMLEEARADLDSILSGMGVPGFGAGRGPEPGIFVSIHGLQFPGGTNKVAEGSEIRDFWYSLTNTSTKLANVWFEVFTHERDLGRIATLLERHEIAIGPGREVNTQKLAFKIYGNKYPREKKIGCTARVSDKDGNKLAQKTFFVYFEIEPEKEEELATIDLRSIEWPRPKSRRVDYDQSLRNISYEVMNNTSMGMKQKLRVRTLWADERIPIDQIAELDMELGPSESKVFFVGQVTVARNRYEEVRRGKIIVRCHSVAMEKTRSWEKGRRLAEHNFSFYLNMDPSYGFFEDPVFFDGGPTKARSESMPGPPCQPFSRANRQKTGMEHPSASAVEHFWRILAELKPDAFLFENVTAFETLEGGSSLAGLVEAVGELGFAITVSKLEAQEFGVPQGRRRLFIGGIVYDGTLDLSRKYRGYESILGSSSNVNGVCVRDAISDLPRLPRGGGGNEISDYSQSNGKELCPFQKIMRSGSSRLFNHWSSRHSEEVMETIRQIKSGLSLAKAWDTLSDSTRRRYSNSESIQSNVYRRLRWKTVAPTIVHPRRAMLLHPKQNRILSVREAARLQTFQDTFRFCGRLDSQYQQVANAVPPFLAFSLAMVFKDNLTRHLVKRSESSTTQESRVRS